MQTSHQSQGSGKEGDHWCEAAGKGLRGTCRSFYMAPVTSGTGGERAFQGKHQATDTRRAPMSIVPVLFVLCATLLKAL